MSKQIAVIGECMMEVKPSPQDKFSGPSMQANIGYGGDTLNTSVYLSRQGIEVEYVTALGDDPVSDWMIGQWRAEGVGCELVVRVAGAVPGMYLIDLDESGERSFFYWRDQAPARRIFDDPARATKLFEALRAFPYLYLSGITLALYRSDVHERVFEFLNQYRADGGKVLFDNNYRPRQWASHDAARTVFERMYRCCDIAMPTIDDEQLLFEHDEAADVLARLQRCGVNEIVLKQGANGCTVATGDNMQHVAATLVKNVVDTTAAGDSFNAGYIGARLEGLAPDEAARRGNALAGRVVQQAGAIIPRDMC